MAANSASAFPKSGGRLLSEDDKIRAVLSAGRALCEEDGDVDPPMPAVLWRLFREAADTFARLPDREQGWIRSGSRVAWPDIAYDNDDKKQAQEQFEVELERVRSGQDQVEAIRLRKGPPDRAAIGRADIIVGWHKHLAGNERARDWKILWLLASDKLSARIVAKECRCSQRTVWRRWEFQLRVIAERLSRPV
jgi:hypothetical protein